MSRESRIRAVGLLATTVAIVRFAAAAAPTGASGQDVRAGDSVHADPDRYPGGPQREHGADAVQRDRPLRLPGWPRGGTEDQLTTYTGRIACTVTTTDLRASGVETGEITMVSLDMPGLKVNKWCEPWSFTTPGRSWLGTEAFGADVWDDADLLRTTGTEGYIGQGDDPGLRMRTLFAQGSNEPANAYVVVGWIEPAD